MGGDDKTFLDAMRGVKIIPATERVKAEQKTPRIVPQKAGGRSMLSPIDHGGPEPGESPWVLAANGVSADMLRRLSSGKIAANAELDLHGMTRGEALDAMDGFFREALSQGSRVLGIVHGRGLHSGGDGPVLKQAAYDWLRHGPLAGHVLAVVPHPRSGGGSCLVLLRRLRV
ncbi:MAG: Smr/MutS family protein [Mariprofundaceae bacterium]